MRALPALAALTTLEAGMLAGTGTQALGTEQEAGTARLSAGTEATAGTEVTAPCTQATRTEEQEPEQE